MRKIIALFLLISCFVCLVGCRAEPDYSHLIGEALVMIDGVLYIHTGETKELEEEHVEVDGQIMARVSENEIPRHNNHSNFGAGYAYRYGKTEGTVEVLMAEKWYIFATEEIWKEQKIS